MSGLKGDLSWEDLESIEDAKGLRQFLQRQQHKKFTVSVEGNIGCGKSTLLDYFERFSSTVETVKEPVHLWTNIKGHNGLQYLYEDPVRWNFSFNYYVLLTRLAMHAQQSKLPVKMLERSLFSVRKVFVENCFRSGSLAEVELALLSEWFDFITSTQKIEIDLFVYLRATPEVCFERIKKRDRKEETTIPFDFIKNLHDLHEDWLINNAENLPAPVLVLDADHELRQMQNIYEENRSQILFGCDQNATASSSSN